MKEAGANLWVLLVVSALLVAGGAVAAFTGRGARSEEGTVVTEARVARLNRAGAATGRSRARVGFSVDGRPATASVDVTSGGVAVGDDLRIRYVADDPATAWVDGSDAPARSPVGPLAAVAAGGVGLYVCAHNLPGLRARRRQSDLVDREAEWKAIVDRLEAESKRRRP